MCAVSDTQQASLDFSYTARHISSNSRAALWNQCSAVDNIAHPDPANAPSHMNQYGLCRFCKGSHGVINLPTPTSRLLNRALQQALFSRLISDFSRHGRCSAVVSLVCKYGTSAEPYVLTFGRSIYRYATARWSLELA